MKLNVKRSAIKTIKSGDPNWLIKNGLYMSPRAGFEISDDCPREYRMIISECVNRGWIKPVAYILDKELVVDILYNS